MGFHFFIYALIIIGANCVEKFCDVTTDKCFVKETLASIAHSPNQLAVDKTTNKLYFSFDSGQGDNVPATLEIETKKLTILKGVKDAFAISNDPSKRDMYFGGSHGIYKYNLVNKTLQRLKIANLDVWWLFYKKKIYFVKFPSLNLYYFDNRTMKSLPGLRHSTVHQMVLDVDNNVFFINNTGFYGIKNDGWLPVLVSDNPKFVAMATDNNGQVYVCAEDGIYAMGKIIQKMKKILNVPGILGFTFDKSNNVIYSDSHELVRLVLSTV